MKSVFHTVAPAKAGSRGADDTRWPWVSRFRGNDDSGR
jgi:hypothetical protein